MDNTLDRNPLAVAFIAGLDKAQEQYHAYGQFPSLHGRVELAQDAYPNDGDDTANVYARGRMDALAELTATLPQTVEQARASAHAALLRWRGLADDARQVTWQHDQQAQEGDGLRVRCAADLLETGAATSQSAADKAASNHPDYLAHKAEARRLAKAKGDAEFQANDAYQTLQNHREYLRERVAAVSLEVSHGMQAVGVALGRVQAGTVERVSGETAAPGDDTLASEALYGFAGWLTTRDDVLTIGHDQDAAPVAELVGQFCDKYRLAEPREDWPDRLRAREQQ